MNILNYPSEPRLGTSYTLELFCGAVSEMLCMDLLCCKVRMPSPAAGGAPRAEARAGSRRGSAQCQVTHVQQREDRHLPAPTANNFLSQQQENKHNNDLPQQQLQAAVPACLQYQ